MRSIQKVYISGLGAIGSSFAGKLHEMDPDCLKVISDNERKERYTKSGIFVNDKAFSFNYIHPEQDADPADLIIIAVKQHHLLQALKDMRRFVNDDTIIISLLNGISSEEIIGKEFGIEKVLYSFVVGVDAVRDGTKTRYGSLGRIVFGDKTNIVKSPKVKLVEELFEKAQIAYRIPENMIYELWRKFMFNVGINQVSAILKATYGDFQNIAEATELWKMASMEVVRISQKAGINLSDNDIKDYEKLLHTLSPTGKTSTLQDIEAHRKTEVEIFAGTIIELGHKYGVDTPINEMLYRMIHVLEQI
jgi:2-dehydropantoate 2-reductase